MLLSRCRNRFLFPAICIFLLAHSLHAQEEVAILTKGPIPMDGIEFLPLNTISVLYGEYEYGQNRAAVYYVERELYISDSWEETSCGDYGLFVFPVPSRDVYYYLDERGWSLFISLDEGMADSCRFMSEFIRRFRYFQGIAKDTRNISFPAVLQFR